MTKSREILNILRNLATCLTILDSIFGMRDSYQRRLLLCLFWTGIVKVWKLNFKALLNRVWKQQLDAFFGFKGTLGSFINLRSTDLLAEDHGMNEFIFWSPFSGRKKEACEWTVSTKQFYSISCRRWFCWCWWIWHNPEKTCSFICARVEKLFSTRAWIIPEPFIVSINRWVRPHTYESISFRSLQSGWNSHCPRILWYGKIGSDSFSKECDEGFPVYCW
jgi:hypothetical protein